MQTPKPITPGSIRLLPAIAAEEGLEALLDRLVAILEINAANNEKLLRLEGRVKRAAHGFTH